MHDLPHRDYEDVPPARALRSESVAGLLAEAPAISAKSLGLRSFVRYTEKVKATHYSSHDAQRSNERHERVDNKRLLNRHSTRRRHNGRGCGFLSHGVNNLCLRETLA
jgi:hypothetical protein